MNLTESELLVEVEERKKRIAKIKQLTDEFREMTEELRSTKRRKSPIPNGSLSQGRSHEREYPEDFRDAYMDSPLDDLVWTSKPPVIDNPCAEVVEQFTTTRGSRVRTNNLGNPPAIVLGAWDSRFWPVYVTLGEDASRAKAYTDHAWANKLKR